MKLIIQIPCFNEAQTLPATLAELPRQLEGIEQVEFLVIDDGSQDGTAEIARQHGVEHVISMKRHVGLAASFAAGLEASLKAGADLIVNTDADNQYHAGDIQDLINPILRGQADMVVGDRGVRALQRFSPAKRLLQSLGSRVVGHFSSLRTPDATSGFRAFSREAALHLLVLSEYSYTLETLIQAGQRGLAVAYVPVRTNPDTRPSRLVRSIPHYLALSSQTIVRAYTMYRPLRVFTALSLVMLAAGFILALRYLYFWWIGQGSGHVQSVILSAVLLIIGFQVFLIGLLADRGGANRMILEELLYRLRRLELKSSQPVASPKQDESD